MFPISITVISYSRLRQRLISLTVEFPVLYRAEIRDLCINKRQGCAE